MDETAVAKPDWLNNDVKGTGDRGENGAGGGGGDGDSSDDEECDAEAWDTLSRSFRQAQSVLDENRALIHEVNKNHASKILDNMVKNVGLIHRINGNISKVLSIYSDLSIDFSNILQQRRIMASTTTASMKEENCDDKEETSVEQVPEKSQMIELKVEGLLPYITARRNEEDEARCMERK